MKIVLCGYMGSGKSITGELLSKELGFLFYDLDEEIEATEKKSIPEIFSSKGEIFFRKKENEVLKTLLFRQGNAIISLGGGTPCYANNLEMIKSEPDTHLVYLKLSFQTLTERLFLEKEKRPLIAKIATKELLEDYIRKHLFERQYYYLQSHIIIDAENNPKALVEEIKSKL